LVDFDDELIGTSLSLVKRNFEEKNLPSIHEALANILSESELRDYLVSVNLPVLYFYTVFYESEGIFVEVRF
jgi:hypothetical protein